MDVRLIILAATFVIFILAVTSFVASVVRHRRARRFAGPLQEAIAAPHGGGGPVDTSLDGLTVEVSADSPSASLLTPLRAGEWMPPDAPAPRESLAEASLSERIAGFQPLPDVAEPEFSIEQYQPWEVEAHTPGVPVRQPAIQEGVVPLALSVPEVNLPTESSSDSTIASDEDLDLELAALMPAATDGMMRAMPSGKTEPVIDAVADQQLPPPLLPPVVVQPIAPAVQPAVPVEPVSASATSMPVPVVPPVPVSVEPAPVAVPEVAAPEVPPPAAAPVVVPVTVAPVAIPVVPDVPVVPATPVAEDVPPSVPVDEYWEDMLREQIPASPRVQVRASDSRPEVRVTATDAPAVTRDEPAPPVRPHRPRPVARVRSPEGQILEFSPDALGETPSHATRGSVPDLVMEAPIEMWFGDARVGVKAGTATFDRFRKYADVLLHDLRASKARAS